MAKGKKSQKKSIVKIVQSLEQINVALNENDLDVGIILTDKTELELLKLPLNFETVQCRGHLGGLMIDLGSWTNDLDLIRKGVKYLDESVSQFPQDGLLVNDLYNLANGYSAIKKHVQHDLFKEGIIPEEHILEKSLYRRAIALLHSKRLAPHEKEITPALFTNYANTLDSIGRPVESLPYYDKALRLQPKKAETLSNKAYVLKRLAFAAKGHVHLFILESKRLFELALKENPRSYFVQHINHHLTQIQQFIDSHGCDIQQEKYRQKKSTKRFHRYLMEFCVQHQLYLTPTTLIGERELQITGDPWFISQMWAKIDDNDKFDKYITFLNQIKQDYIFARYLLAQSQYSTKYADIIDEGVDYYYPLDYSLYSSYVEMMKISFRLAVDTLDKVSYFIHDYCEMTSIAKDKVNFRNVWSSNNDPLRLRPELAQRGNLLLFGMLDLALDLRKDGYFENIYQRRNAITHRFLSVHSESVIEDDTETMPKVQIDQFRGEAIQALQLTKAAIMYLILFVDSEEQKHRGEGLAVPTTSPTVDELFRWKPYSGE